MDDIHKSAGIIIKDKKFLFTRAKDMAIFIDPGGQIEPRETPEQALVRDELKEELDIEVSESDLEFFGEYSAEAANHMGRTVHMKAFVVKKYAGEIKVSSEIEELRWLTSDISVAIKVWNLSPMKLIILIKIGVIKSAIPKPVQRLRLNKSCHSHPSPIGASEVSFFKASLLMAQKLISI